MTIEVESTDFDTSLELRRVGSDVEITNVIFLPEGADEFLIGTFPTRDLLIGLHALLADYVPPSVTPSPVVTSTAPANNKPKRRAPWRRGK